MAFAICAGDYACGCVNAQLVVDIVEYETDAVPVQRLNLEIKLPFPGGAEDAVSVCFV